MGENACHETIYERVKLQRTRVGEIVKLIVMHPYREFSVRIINKTPQLLRGTS